MSKNRAVDKDFNFCMGLLVAVCLCGVCVLAGCEDKTKATPRPASTKEKSVAIESKKVDDFQARLEDLLEPDIYCYSSEGKPDPFQPFLKNAFGVSRQTAQRQSPKKEIKRPKVCATPLECMDVGQLTLVSIVSNDKGKRVAMVQDAAGLGYFLYPGLRVGYRNGRVKQILSDRVIVEEEFENIRGELTLHDRILLLHPEGK
jgi:Tfp pilus assembly protein PilP